ncbi:uncharacterized protein BDV17DRAFT_286004 [Aspergillus undulatus]|uniref:uncharacterized protein n=1 Tax=Aspergillus undulatus TaxID=1810928 RepID=UPI003CCDE3F9
MTLLWPGALGKGQGVATGLNHFFTGWCYMAPIVRAVIADSWPVSDNLPGAWCRNL